MTMTIITPTAIVQGPAISLCQREDLDAYAVDWPQHTAANLVEDWAFDERDERACYVSPPPGSDTFVEVIVDADPIAPATYASPLGVADQYQTALRHLLCCAALQKDLEGGGQQRADWHWQMARQVLGIVDRQALTSSGNLNDQRGIPSRQLAAGAG